MEHGIDLLKRRKRYGTSLSKHYLSVVGGSILLDSENEEDALFSFTSERRRYLREREMKNSLKDSSISKFLGEHILTMLHFIMRHNLNQINCFPSMKLKFSQDSYCATRSRILSERVHYCQSCFYASTE
jgi:hypothetical protein